MALLKKIIQFLSTTSEGPFARKGNGLQHLEEVLQIIFFVRSDDYKDKVKMCFKVKRKIVIGIMYEIVIIIFSGTCN